MKHSKLFYWSVVVALAGFLFGFDTVVISGADKQLQQIWNTSELFHGMVIMSMALWGTVLGAIFGSLPTNKLGRKKTLVLIGVFFLIGSIGTALAYGPYSFAFFRFIGGLGVGISTIAAPAYVSEIAPPKNRGKLVALYQFNIVFGILMAYVSNYLLKDIGVNSWRWMLGIQMIPATIYSLLVWYVPESPRWLILYRNNIPLAKSILYKIDNSANLENEINRILAEKERQKTSDGIFSSKYRKSLFLAFFIAFFNQFSGINAFLYYAPRIFELAGLEKSASFLSSIMIGIINMVFTIIGISLIDKFGRKTLLYLGSIGYILSLALVTLAFSLKWEGFLVPFFFFVFIAAHAIGQGAVIWVFIAEIFPNKLRASGQSFGSSVHWILAALIPSFIPFLFKNIGPPVVFGFFCLMMILQLLWVRMKMPETKGISLETLSEDLVPKK